VSDLAVNISILIGYPKEKIESIKIASILHYIGKIAIPYKILLKEGRLTDKEYATIKTYPIIGEDILHSFLLIDTERELFRYHHERWDGRGYPDGLSGENIPPL